ncbi:MAG: TonB-dependent receptor [Nevskia sp.]
MLMFLARSPGCRAAVGGLAATLLSVPALAADAGNAFNPKISLVLQGNFVNYDAESPALIPGYLLGNESGLRSVGLSIDETELAIESNIDDLFHGWATISLANDNGNTKVNVEEAFINTLTLPYGLAAKGGRFYSDIGYLNRIHSHAWDFADQPLVYRAFLSNQYADDGLQLKWVAPLDLFVEVGGELARGGAFPGGGGDRPGVPAKSVFVHVGDDLSASSSYRAGLSYLHVSTDRRTTGEDAQTAFSGRSGTAIADFVWKWAPNGNPTIHNATVAAEVFYRHESGALLYDPNTQAIASNYHGNQGGFYVQGIYQFVPQWRVGVRYDRLQANNAVSNPATGTSLETLAENGRHPQRYTVMLDWSHSEFSRIRLQYNRDESRPNAQADNQVYLQYIFALGSHPAHQF